MSDQSNFQSVNGSDARAMIHLLGDAAAMDGNHHQVKCFIMNGLSEIIGADSWVWTLACQIAPDQPHPYVGFSHGGFDETRFATFLTALEHPDMAEAVKALYLQIEKTLDHTTMLLEEIDPDNVAGNGDVRSLWEKADIGPVIISGYPLDTRSVSMIGTYRRYDKAPFTKREKQIVHIILNEIPWLHQMGWPEDRGVTVPRLQPRQRITLNLLMEGLQRKVIADKMGITENTVAGYARDIFAHFGVTSQLALMQKFLGGMRM